MLAIFDEVVCQLRHGRWSQIVSYSRQGAWGCAKRGCPAQARHDSAQRLHPSPQAQTIVQWRPPARTTRAADRAA